MGTGNLGGPSVSASRFALYLASLSRLPSVLALTEFRNSEPLSRYERLAIAFGYHLLASPGNPTGGLAILVHSSVAPSAPPLHTIVPSRIAYTSLCVHQNLDAPPLKIVAFYGSNKAKERALYERPLGGLLKDNCIILGDFNATTQDSDSTCLSSNHWPWLQSQEKCNNMIDVIRPPDSPPPFTRVRGYHGTKSYIDRVYLSRMADTLFHSHEHWIDDFSKPDIGTDHNPIMCCIGDWGSIPPVGPRCTYWNKRTLQQYKQKVMVNAPSPPLQFMSLQHGEVWYASLTSHIRQVLKDIDEARPKRPPTQVQTFDQIVKTIATQARRRTKVFYRRLKHAFAMPRRPPAYPVPTRRIRRILQEPPIFSHMDALPKRAHQTRKPDPPPPSINTLRELSKGPRNKAPGPDGVPPYALHHLPDPLFQGVHALVLAMYDSHAIPPSISESETVCFYKSGDWRQGDRWRPIALSNSLYRTVARWIYHQLVPILSPLISNWQFGGLSGRTTAAATFQLFEHLADTPGHKSIGMIDFFHAFDSPPKRLLLDSLDRAGVPRVLLLMIRSVYIDGTTFFRGEKGRNFGTPKGVKQGCPMSCLIFVLFIDPILVGMQEMGIKFVAFVDDIAMVIPQGMEQAFFEHVQKTAAALNMQLNVKKNEIMGIHTYQPPSIKLPTFLLPNMPCSDTGILWYFYHKRHAPPLRSPPPQSTLAAVPVVKHIVHLGHPVPSSLSTSDTLALVQQELEHSLKILGAQPLPPMPRADVTRTVLAPSLLHRLECVAPMPKDLFPILQRLVDYFLQVQGVPIYVTTKTLFSHQSCGFGLPFLPILQPTRVLNSVQKASNYCNWKWQPNGPHFRPSALFAQARDILYGNYKQRVLPFSAPPPGLLLDRDLFGLSVFRHSYDLPHLGDGHSDGSYHLHPERSGSAAVCPNGYVYLARTPGNQGIYKAEVIGVLLDSVYSPPEAVLYTDNQGVSKVLSHDRPVLKESYWISKTRESIRSKQQQVEWEKGHVGIRGNEIADKYANVATTLPMPGQPGRSLGPWEVGINGEIMYPPHKVWTHARIPRHSPKGIHNSSYSPLKRNNVRWYKWHYALVWRPKYMSPTSFWVNAPSKKPCCMCKEHHNQSVHGYLAFCKQHPLYKAWGRAWGPYSDAVRWRHTANKRDTFLIGKLCIPQSLYILLKSQLGARGASTAIKHFQHNVLDLLHDILPPPPDTYRAPRPSPYNVADWDFTRPPPKARNLRNLHPFD